MALRSTLRRLLHRLTGRPCGQAAAPTRPQASNHASNTDIRPEATPVVARPEPVAAAPEPGPAAPLEPAASPAAVLPAEPPPSAPAFEPVEVKKVWIKHPDRVLALANAADEETLRSWGLRGAGLTSVLAGRPFTDVATLGATDGVGRRTLQHLAQVTDT